MITEEDKVKIEQYQKDFIRYPKPSVTADIIAVRPAFDRTDRDNWRKNLEFSIEILFIKRGLWPYENYWALPGGFLREGESIEECAKRELIEETALKAETLIPIGLFSKPGRDMRAWIISNAFISIHEHNAITRMVHGGDDAAMAKWLRVVDPEIYDGHFTIPFYDGDKHLFTLTGRYKPNTIGPGQVIDVDENPLAFDHGEIIAQALLNMLSLDIKELAFYFLPKKFTLAEYIDVYLYLARKGKDEVDIPNFRRQLTAKSNPLLVICRDDNGNDEYEKLDGRGHARARLYRRS